MCNFILNFYCYSFLRFNLLNGCVNFDYYRKLSILSHENHKNKIKAVEIIFFHGRVLKFPFRYLLSFIRE